jgi:hypothetical protein
MIELPIIYFGSPVAHALVDDAFADLRSLIWRMEVPRSVRNLCKNRSDVVLALLREDPAYQRRCRPHTNPRKGLCIRLSHVVLRPPLVPLLLGEINDSTALEIRSLSSSVRRVVFLNDSRLDCRTENLREVT